MPPCFSHSTWAVSHLPICLGLSQESLANISKTMKNVLKCDVVSCCFNSFPMFSWHMECFTGHVKLWSHCLNEYNDVITENRSTKLHLKVYSRMPHGIAWHILVSGQPVLQAASIASCSGARDRSPWGRFLPVPASSYCPTWDQMDHEMDHEMDPCAGHCIMTTWQRQHVLCVQEWQEMADGKRWQSQMFSALSCFKRRNEAMWSDERFVNRCSWHSAKSHGASNFRSGTTKRWWKRDVFHSGVVTGGESDMYISVKATTFFTEFPLPQH
jgi:hypothetical protein